MNQFPWLLGIIVCILADSAFASDEKDAGAARVVHITKFEKRKPFLRTTDPKVVIVLQHDPSILRAKELVDGYIVIPSAWAKSGGVLLRVHDPKEKEHLKYAAKVELANLGKSSWQGYEDSDQFSFVLRRDFFEASRFVFRDEKGLVVLHCHAKPEENKAE